MNNFIENTLIEFDEMYGHNACIAVEDVESFLKSKLEELKQEMLERDKRSAAHIAARESNYKQKILALKAQKCEKHNCLLVCLDCIGEKVHA